MRHAPFALMFFLAMLGSTAALYDQPETGKPADPIIQNYLAQEARRLEASFLAEIKTHEDWERERPRLKQEYLEMLGLWPLPEKSDLKATITRTLDRGEYAVEMIHYQSRPGLYVTGNLYRPAKVNPGEKLPAIFYVCGHSGRGRNGNKTAFQSHGIWFARHGYVCLIVDTLQLGEIAGIHHGTYREGRWWWLSRGYTPAGVECWNGIRGIDYLVTRPDVDPERIGVTGISGGGASTFWIAAADERVKAAAPVSGMADLVSYIPNRVINGHCDCMFLYNTYQWHWTRIAGLIAPRPLLFVNSDQDTIFPMDANERVINNLERLYSLFGKSDLVDALVSVGGHDYRTDIRQGTYRFMNIFLKNDPRPVGDSEVDLVTGPGETIHPIEPEQLRVFPADSDIPSDTKNARIDPEFVPIAKVAPPEKGQFEAWKNSLIENLRRMTFHHFPQRIPSADESPLAGENMPGAEWLKTEPGISIRLFGDRQGTSPEIYLVVASEGPSGPVPDWAKVVMGKDPSVFLCEPRGMGAREWTKKNPPNYVERAHYLLGRTADSGRVWDIAATARYLKEREKKNICVVAEKKSAVLAVYAALLEPDINRLILKEPPETLNGADAPALLNALRVCDIPDAIGLVAPREVTLVGEISDAFKNSRMIYESADATVKFEIQKF